MRRDMTMLRVGDRAPPFEALALDGSAIQPATNDRWTLISFLRYASCPMCNLRVRELTQKTAKLESRGIAWIAVYHSPAERLTRYLNAEQRSRVVADPHKRLYKLYGIQRSWLGMLVTLVMPSFYWRFLKASALGYWGGAIEGGFHSMPADFLVSPDGIITRAHYGKHIGDHLDLTFGASADR